MAVSLSRGAHSKGSVVLYLVLTLAIATGSIVLLYQASFRVRDRQVRYGPDEILARFLARGAVETLAYGVELDVGVSLPPRPGGTSLRDVLALDGRALAAFIAQQTRGRDDHRKLLELLLGERPFQWIERMRTEHPQSRLTYKLDLAVTGKPFPGLSDPVEKMVDLGLEARCEVGHAESTYRNVLTLAVYSELPWVLSKFALICPDAQADSVNTLSTTVRGEAIGPSAPVVVFNAPEDFSADDPLFGGTGRAEGVFAPELLAATTAELAAKLAARGASYLGAGSPERPLTLRLASGGAPAGQNFQALPASAGSPRHPQASPLADQPPRLVDFRPLTAGGGPAQRPWVQGAVLGYYQGIDSEQLLGPAATGEDGGDASALIRPVGTAAHPSAGLVYGNAWAGLAALSDLAIDRDATGADEVAQRSTGRGEPAERDGVDPFLRNVRSSEFQADVAREASGLPPQFLNPFSSPELAPGFVTNLNAALEPDPADATVRLDLSKYRYGELFGSWREYSRTMSKRVSVPYNALLRAASGPGDPAGGLLERTAFGATAPSLQADLLREARWQHRDPLHAQLERTAGHRDYVDTTDDGRAGLDRLVRIARRRPRYSPAFVTCKGEALFRESFLAGTVLDLAGCDVSVTAAAPPAPAPRLDLGDLQVAPGGGGVLRASEVKLRSLTNRSTGKEFSPVVMAVGRLVLQGAGPFEGCFIVEESLALEGEASPAVVRGFVYDGRGSGLSSLSGPLAIVFDPRLDPTGPEAHEHYRTHLLFGAGPRVFGMGGFLVDSSDYRRPAEEPAR